MIAPPRQRLARSVLLLLTTALLAAPTAFAAPNDLVRTGPMVELGVALPPGVANAIEVPVRHHIDTQHAPLHERLIERTERFVEEFDPTAPPHEQLKAVGVYAKDMSTELNTIFNSECVVFVADPTILNWVDVDLSDFPDRIRVRTPFAMTVNGDVTAGYLLVAMRLSGEVSCGTDLFGSLLA